MYVRYNPFPDHLLLHHSLHLISPPLLLSSEIQRQAWLWWVRSGGKRDCGEWWDLVASVIVASEIWRRAWLWQIADNAWFCTVSSRTQCTSAAAQPTSKHRRNIPELQGKAQAAMHYEEQKVTENFCFVWCAWRIFHWVASLMTYRRILQASCTSPMARLNGWPLMTQKFVNLQLEVRRDTYIIVSVLSRGTERCL